MPTPLKLTLKAFLMDCEMRSLSPNTLKFYENTIGPFIDNLGELGVQNVDDVIATHIRFFINSLEDVSDSTKHAYARGIRAWLNFCVREEWLTSSPMKSVRMPKRKKKILPSFTPDEVDRILDACTCERDKAICMFLLDTGCRLTECAKLEVTDIDLKTGTVFLSEDNTKGGKFRTVYFGNRTRKQLMHYFAELGAIPEEGPLWISQLTGAELTAEGIKMMFKRMRDRLNIPHLSPHTFRRTFAIQSLRNGMDIFMLQRLMGHSDLSVIQQYLDIVRSDLEEATKKFGVMDNY